MQHPPPYSLPPPADNTVSFHYPRLIFSAYSRFVSRLLLFLSLSLSLSFARCSTDGYLGGSTFVILFVLN